MKNSKKERMKPLAEEHETRSSAAPVQVTDKMWREACASGKKAKELLVNMAVGGKGKVTFVQLSNGGQIPVGDVTEKQALDFIQMLAPERIWKGFRQ